MVVPSGQLGSLRLLGVPVLEGDRGGGAHGPAGKEHAAVQRAAHIGCRGGVAPVVGRGLERLINGLAVPLGDLGAPLHAGLFGVAALFNAVRDHHIVVQGCHGNAESTADGLLPEVLLIAAFHVAVGNGMDVLPKGDIIGPFV